MLELSNASEFAGRYGEEPRVESVTLLRNDLYRRIEEDVRDWINETRFVPRFLIAAGAFLVVYLFLSLVIRDPLPIVDEVVAALGAGGGTFVLVGRRFENSRVAYQRRVALRSKVDSVVFSEDAFVREVENLLQVLEEVPPEADPRTEDVKTRVSEIRSRYPDQSTELVRHLRHLVAAQPYRGLARAMRKGKLSARMLDQIQAGSVVPAAVHLLTVMQQRG